MTKPVSRTALHAEVTARLREMIVEGVVAQGTRVNERLLCEELQISRTPLREALKYLAAEGLVELSPNRGATVTLLSSKEVAKYSRFLPGWRVWQVNSRPPAPLTLRLPKLANCTTKWQGVTRAKIGRDTFVVIRPFTNALVWRLTTPYSIQHTTCSIRGSDALDFLQILRMKGGSNRCESMSKFLRLSNNATP